MHFIQSVLGPSSIAVTEKYYAKFRLESAAKAVLATVESARKGQNLAQNLAQQR
jgi:hypothetical protein